MPDMLITRLNDEPTRIIIYRPANNVIHLLLVEFNTAKPPIRLTDCEARKLVDYITAALAQTVKETDHA
jgi:hypothetical protein